MLSTNIFSPVEHRTAKGAERIENLIAAASELFLEHGFDMVSVDDIIARVGGSRRNVYSHFGGKEGLFRAAMFHVANEMSRPLDEIKIEGLHAREVLPLFGRQLVQTALSARTLAVHRLLTNEGRRFPEIAQSMLGSSYLKILNRLADWIGSQQSNADSELANYLPANVLAEQFMSLTSSHVKLRAIVGLVQLPLSDAELESIVHHAVYTFLHGARKRSEDHP